MTNATTVMALAEVEEPVFQFHILESFADFGKQISPTHPILAYVAFALIILIFLQGTDWLEHQIIKLKYIYMSMRK